MALTVISGEIAAQPLNDNFSEGKANLDTHLAEQATDDVHGLLTGGKIIEEVGSNANGEYIRFADGTQICSVAKTLEYVTSTHLGAGGNWTYPASFNSIPKIFVGKNAGSTVAKLFRSAVAGDGTSTFATLRVFATSGDSFISGDTISVSGLAAGRWK